MWRLLFALVCVHVSGDISLEERISRLENHAPSIHELEARVERLEREAAAARARLERETVAARARVACKDSFPMLREQDQFLYSGCNRNVPRNTTGSIETCQNGTVTVYNTSSTPKTGLFDVSIAANVPTHDVWNFVCALARGTPHEAVCTLTFEEPLRPEGPAWLSVRFRSVARDPKLSSCRAAEATFVGSYPYDALTHDAGVYVFYSHATVREQP